MTPEMKRQYDEYLDAHISNVQNAYNWIVANLPDWIPAEIADLTTENLLAHDRSKYSDEEYIPYADYFYGKKNAQVEADFNLAWLHHIHANPHHWQHWVLIHDDEPEELIEMPREYLIEMFCDWWAFSWKSNNLYSVFDWYEQHKDMRLNDNTRRDLERLMQDVKAILDRGE